VIEFLGILVIFIYNQLPEPAAPADYSVAKKARLCDDSADEVSRKQNFDIHIECLLALG
jgi:hypothetical protein